MNLKDSALNRHKTKALGLATVVLGFLQTDPQLKALLPEAAYAWLMVVVGLGTVVCGFLNTFQAPPEDSGGPDYEGGYIRAPMLALILALSVALAALPGCAQLGFQTSGGFNDRLAAGYSLVAAISEGAGIVLDSKVRAAQNEPDPERRRALIAAARADAQNLKDQAQAAKEALDVARSLRGVNFEAAEERLVSTLRVLEALQRYLEENP